MKLLHETQNLGNLRLLMILINSKMFSTPLNMLIKCRVNYRHMDLIGTQMVFVLIHQALIVMKIFLTWLVSKVTCHHYSDVYCQACNEWQCQEAEVHSFQMEYTPCNMHVFAALVLLLFPMMQLSTSSIPPMVISIFSMMVFLFWSPCSFYFPSGDIYDTVIHQQLCTLTLASCNNDIDKHAEKFQWLFKPVRLHLSLTDVHVHWDNFHKQVNAHPSPWFQQYFTSKIIKRHNKFCTEKLDYAKNAPQDWSGYCLILWSRVMLFI